MKTNDLGHFVEKSRFMVPPVIDILGFFMSSGYSAAFIFLTEIVDSEKRAKLGLSVNVLFGAGSVFYSLGGYMFRNWRHLITWVISLTNRRAGLSLEAKERKHFKLPKRLRKRMVAKSHSKNLKVAIRELNLEKELRRSL